MGGPHKRPLYILGAEQGNKRSFDILHEAASPAESFPVRERKRRHPTLESERTRSLPKKKPQRMKPSSSNFLQPTGRFLIPSRVSVNAYNRLYQTLSRTCPSCSTPLPTALPTCPKCQYISPLPSSMSYFQYFNLPDVDSSNPYVVDLSDLRRRYLRTQRVCHPDIWSQKGEVNNYTTIRSMMSLFFLTIS